MTKYLEKLNLCTNNTERTLPANYCQFMKVKLEEIRTDADSSFKILLTPNLNDLFYWHFHPEYEIVYVEGANGIRHVGDHISRYEGSDLVLIGPNIPHLNFDYGVKTECEQVVVQMKEDFLGKDFFNLPEMSNAFRVSSNPCCSLATLVVR